MAGILNPRSRLENKSEASRADRKDAAKNVGHIRGRT